MQQRRTPGGQRPARRPGQSGRPGGGPRRGRSVREARRTRRAAAPPVARRGAARGAEGVRSASRPAAARRAAAGGAAKRHRRTAARAASPAGPRCWSWSCRARPGLRLPGPGLPRQQAEIERMEAAQAEQRERIEELAARRRSGRTTEYIEIAGPGAVLHGAARARCRWSCCTTRRAPPGTPGSRRRPPGRAPTLVRHALVERPGGRQPEPGK